MIRNVEPHAARDRGISTVLDAAVFLLLVSAAIGLLYAAPQTEGDGGADPDVAAETATTLATSIETIEYAPSPGGDAEPGANRSDRGTVAELLAETTVANAGLGGESFTRAPDHEAAVRSATLRTVRRVDEDVRIQVSTQWRPLPGSGLRGGMQIGQDPPEVADVHAATTAVPVGTATSAGPTVAGWSSDGTRHRTGSLVHVASEHGCAGFGRVLADRVVGTAFPPGPTEQALRAGGEPTALAEARYATAASALGVDPGTFHDEMTPRRRNQRLAAELAGRFAATCEGYDSPSDAAERAAPGTVHVSVRTWSP